MGTVGRITVDAKGKLLLAVLLISCCGVARAQTMQPWEKARAEQVAAARREGILAPAGTPVIKPVPPEQNAATYITKLEALDKTARVSGTDIEALDKLGSGFESPDVVAAARKAFEAHLDRYALIRQIASSSDYAQKSGSLTVGDITVQDDFPKMARLRDCARWVSYKALLLAADGKPMEGVKEASLAFGLAQLAAKKGGIITYLVGIAVDAIGVKTLSSVLKISKDDGAVAAAVQQAVEARPAMALSATLRAELADYLGRSASYKKSALNAKGNSADTDITKDPDYRDSMAQYHYPKDPKLAAARLFDMNDANFISAMRRIIPAADLPYPEAIARIGAVAAEISPLEKNPDKTLAGMVIDMVGNLPTVAARHTATAETMRAAAAVIAWKVQHGHLPATLAEAMNPPATDPYDQKPLRYRTVDAGFVIYSVGKTGKFDGGKQNVKVPAGEVAMWWK